MLNSFNKIVTIFEKNNITMLLETFIGLTIYNGSHITLSMRWIINDLVVFK